jgi:hypothetical protein
MVAPCTQMRTPLLTGPMLRANCPFEVLSPALATPPPPSFPSSPHYMQYYDTDDINTHESSSVGHIYYFIFADMAACVAYRCVCCCLI